MQTIFIRQDSGGHFVVDQNVVRAIGYIGENGVTDIEFVAPLAFAEWVWTIDTPNDIVPLPSLIDDRGTVLRWKIERPQLSQKQLTCNLRAEKDGKTKKTDQMVFNVRSAVDIDSIYPLPLPTEFTQAEKRMRELLAKMEDLGGVSQDEINEAVNKYLDENPVTSATATIENGVLKVR